MYLCRFLCPLKPNKIFFLFFEQAIEPFGHWTKEEIMKSKFPGKSQFVVTYELIFWQKHFYFSASKVSYHGDNVRVASLQLGEWVLMKCSPINGPGARADEYAGWLLGPGENVPLRKHTNRHQTRGHPSPENWQSEINSIIFDKAPILIYMDESNGCMDGCNI